MSNTIMPIAPPPAPTLGQHVDAITIALHERVALLEAATGKDVATVGSWVKGNAIHVINLGGIAAGLLKLFGKI